MTTPPQTSSSDGMLTAETMAWVGRALGETVFDVPRADILKFAYSTSQTRDIHLSVDAAVNAGYRDLVAPYDFYIVLRNTAAALVPLADLRDDGTVKGDMPPLLTSQRTRAGEVDVEFFSHITAGDRVRVSRRISDITTKTGRSGQMIMVTYETTIDRLPEEEPVVVERYTRIVMA